MTVVSAAEAEGNGISFTGSWSQTKVLDICDDCKDLNAMDHRSS